MRDRRERRGGGPDIYFFSISAEVCDSRTFIRKKLERNPKPGIQNRKRHKSLFQESAHQLKQVTGSKTDMLNSSVSFGCENWSRSQESMKL